MGVKVFRDDNWNRIKLGVISRRDVMNLDAEKDMELIRYLIVHAPLECGISMLEYAKEKYGIERVTEPIRNIDDPDDPYYEEYFVLREQVAREDNSDVLKEAALHSSNYDVAAFAFCRLTGYSFSSDECDAYSYRTFDCGTMPGMTTEDIREFCRIMNREGNPFKDAAEQCLRKQKDTDQ